MSQASEDLALALEARRKVLRFGTAKWGTRQITRESLSEINATIKDLKREVAGETAKAAGRNGGPAIARFC